MQKVETQFSEIFVILGGLFLTSLLISNIIAGKLISVYNMVLPAGTVLFPITYIFGDVLTEVYGFKKSRLIIWVGFACNLFMAAIFTLVVLLPHPSFWNGQEAYAVVLGMIPRLVLASLIAYFLGEYCNSAVLSKMKLLTQGKWLWTRTIGSTIVGEGVDTIIFITIAFWAAVPNSVLFQMIVLQYIWKIVYEIVLTPVTYIVVDWIKRKEGIDTYDNGVKYNPFSLEV